MTVHPMIARVTIARPLIGCQPAADSPSRHAQAAALLCACAGNWVPRY